MYEGVRDSTNLSKKLTPEEKAKKEAASLYQRCAKLVGLSLQSLNINYDRKHFENCDMSTEQMRALLDAEVAQGGKKGDEAHLTIEEFSKLIKFVGGKSMLVNFGIRLSGLSDRFKAELKFLLVVSGETDDERETDSLISPRCLKLITEDRNEYFLKELSRKLKQRSDVKHFVVFYGAAHLSGMEKGLRELGYVPAGPVKWLKAITSHPYAEGLRQDEVSEIVNDALAKYPVN